MSPSRSKRPAAGTATRKSKPASSAAASKEPARRAGATGKPAKKAGQKVRREIRFARPTLAGARATERLRKLCLALPEATERLSHGEATWFVQGKRVFAMMSDHHHDDRLAFTCPAADGAQEVLVATRPEKFYRPPYVGHLGWLGVYLDVPGVDWGEIADLVVDAYRLVAPPKLRKRAD